MTESIVMHRSAIQTVGRTITPTGAETFDGFISDNVYDLAPAKLDTSQLPALYSLLGAATYEESSKGENFQIVKRVYRVQVPVLPIGIANAQIRESRCQPLLERVILAFGGYPTLGNTLWVLKSKVISDSGIVVLPEFGAQYVGFEVRLQVEYALPKTFATGE